MSRVNLLRKTKGIFRSVTNKSLDPNTKWLYTSAAAVAKSLQSCLILCNPRDGSPPGSPVPGTLQARVLEWDVIAFSVRM